MNKPVITTYMVAKVRFKHNYGELYSYRVPKHLEAAIEVGMTAIVGMAGATAVNPSWVEVVKLIDAIDDDCAGNKSYAYVIGVCDCSWYNKETENERRRKHLLSMLAGELNNKLGEVSTTALKAFRGRTPLIDSIIDAIEALD